MAEHIAGSEENFIKMMNDKAKQLGMENTCFKNCHGIDEEGHYTTARDISKMSRELIINHPDILKYTSIWMDSLRDGTFGLTNTNKLIRFYDGAIGLKTGYTSAAGYNLSACAKRDDTMYLSVVMKAPSLDIRSEETKQLLDFAFANYNTQKILDKENEIIETKINKSLYTTLKCGVNEDITILKNKGSDIDITNNVVFSENLVAPINKGDIIGSIDIIDKSTNEIIEKKELIAMNNLGKSNIKDYLKYVFNLFLLNPSIC